MIYLAGQRTDIVARYTPWLLRRLEEGYCLVRNPVAPSRLHRYSLAPDEVDALVFCSKNYGPLLPHLGKVAARYPVLCQFTVTAYGRDIEPGVPDRKTRIEQMLRLSDTVGPERVIWRYDPVFVDPTYTVERHLATFRELCGHFAPRVLTCVFNFLHRFPGQAKSGLHPIPDRDRHCLAEGMARTAEHFHMPLQMCACDPSLVRHGILSRACLSQDVLERALGNRYPTPWKKIPVKGARPGCHCVESRDLGAYDSCANGCLYCYANTSRERVRAAVAAHDPLSPLLVGCPGPGDVVVEAAQRRLVVPAKQRAPARGGLLAAVGLTSAPGKAAEGEERNTGNGN